MILFTGKPATRAIGVSVKQASDTVDGVFNPTCSLFNKIVEKSGKNAAFSW